MKLSYFHVAEDVPEHFVPESAVVIDVLRATTTIAWALNNGAKQVEVFEDLDQLRKRASEYPEMSRILLGERGGAKIDGFDLGNSPLGVTPEIVSGKSLLMSTTNGTRALNRVRNVEKLYTVALVNRNAVAEKLLSEKPKEVWIVGSGWVGSYSLEDSFAAGSLAARLLEHDPDCIEVVNDELVAALSLWTQWKDDREACLRNASHGKRLSGLGNHDADFKCCSELDVLQVVPTQVKEGVLSA